jgi:hypothetical protein
MKNIKVYNGEQLVQHSVHNLWSDEWYLFTPKQSEMIIGDRLVVEKGCDLDSLIIQWG